MEEVLEGPFVVSPAPVMKYRYNLEYGFHLYDQIIILLGPIVKFICFIYNIEQTQYYGGT